MVLGEMHLSDGSNPDSLLESETSSEDQPALGLRVEGGAQIVWEDRWHEEEIFANRLSFYILAQSFLVVAAVTATLTSDATFRWLPVALTIDLTGLVVTLVFWYALTENYGGLTLSKGSCRKAALRSVCAATGSSGRLGHLTTRPARVDICRSSPGGRCRGGWLTGYRPSLGSCGLVSSSRRS
jgi:hypothetical protein